MDPSLIEAQRLAFLAAAYQGDGEGALHACRQALESFVEAVDPGEGAQKTAAQLRRSIRVLCNKKRLSSTCARDLQVLEKRLGRRLATLARTREATLVDAPAWRTSLGLSPERVDCLLATLTSLQLSVGCSHYCRRCNEWALPGVRRHFDFKAVKSIVSAAYRAGNRDFSLYCASDPLDWRDGDFTIADVQAFLQAAGIHLRYGLLTKVPRGGEGIICRLVTQGTDFAVSLTAGNRERVRRLEKQLPGKLAVQHDFEDLLIPAGLDEDFESVKASITDNYGTEITPEGASLVVPTFTSALYPTGQCRIPVTAGTPFFLQRRTGRPALLVEYFKPLAVVDTEGNAFVLEYLLDVQVETLLLDTGRTEAVPPGMSDLAAYFDTFEAPAALRRRRMLSTIVKRHRQRFLIDASPPDRDGFRHRVRDYVRFCREPVRRRLKVAAFSFLLQAVRSYCRTHGLRRTILRHLRKDGPPPDLSGVDIHRRICETGKGHRDLFQELAACLLADAANPQLARFLEENPALHDPVTGRYRPIPPAV